MKNFLKFIFLITVFFSTNLISQNIQLKTVIEEFEVKTWEDGPESAELTNHEVSGHKDGNYIVYWKGDVERDYESRYYGNLYNNEGILLKKNIRFFKELSLNDYSLVDFSPKIIFNRDNSFKVFGICKDDGYYVVYEEYDRYGDLVKGWTKIFILSYLDRFIVSSDSTGNFIVANENRYLNRGIFVQKFDIDGNRINEIKPISSGNSPKICINNKGDFLAAWTESTIYTKKVGQLFNSNCDPISEIFTIQDSLQYFNSNSNNCSITYNKNNFIFLLFKITK
ncbi:MAG: hypothetical protein IPK06_02010 [Ignavibacteriae bacterium]|nr:hypothetical protein [Ignavibacteriota bacterium]